MGPFRQAFLIDFFLLFTHNSSHSPASLAQLTGQWQLSVCCIGLDLNGQSEEQKRPNVLLSCPLNTRVEEWPWALISHALTLCIIVDV